MVIDSGGINFSPTPVTPVPVPRLSFSLIDVNVEISNFRKSSIQTPDDSSILLISMPPPTSFAALRSLSRLTSRTSLAIPRLLVAPQCPSRQALPKNFYRSFSSSYPYRSAGRPLYESADPANQPPKEPRAEQPSYQITVTCEPCGTRSSHKVSKQGYHHGSTLITCPQCKNRHVISDHLKVGYAVNDTDLKA